MKNIVKGCNVVIEKNNKQRETKKRLDVIRTL